MSDGTRLETERERNAKIARETIASLDTPGASPYAEVLRKREERCEAPISQPLRDLNWLLAGSGPYFDVNTDVTDALVFGRLDDFGLAVWEVESPSERSFARGTWIDWLKANLVGVSEPWRLVDDAMKAGRRRHETEKLAASNGRPRWYLDTELAELPPTVDLVVGHLPAEGVVLFYGPSGHGKTHLLLDIAQSVATGQPWHGHAVQQGPVAYVIAEGIGGLARRVDAWKAFHEWRDATGVRFRPYPVHLLESTDAAVFLADLQTWDPLPILIVLDTLAWCIAPGDENSTRDMSAFVAAIGELRSTLHATVALVHHTGRDTSRERGNTALAAACDTVVQVKEEDGRIVVTCTKQRESPPFAPIRFRLVERNGSVIPQRAIDDSTGDEVSGKEQEALKALQGIYVAGEGVSSTRWNEAAEMSRATFYRARKRLIELGYVRIEKSKHFLGSDREVSLSHDVPF